MHMALREIVIVGDEILRKRSREVTQFDIKLAELLDDMAETMRFEGRGIGLAAPQVGVLKRIFVVDIGDEHGLIEFINPEIISAEGCVVGSEGCLSVPGKSGDVERPETIVIRALDRNGTSFELTATGLLAVCICHENDHLDGILFIDKVRGQTDSD
jgi:peptide deformylase